MMSFSPSTPLPTSKYKRNSFESSVSPLFSPSAAARYAVQTEKWNQVDKWLARVFFPNRVPEFERNEETLSYLYSLSAVSTQRTKEKKALLAAQKRMIEEYKRRASELETTLKAAGLASESLDVVTMEKLEELVEIGMVLNVDPMSSNFLAIAKALSNQIDCEDDLEISLHEAKLLQSSLEGELAGINALKTRLEQAQRIQDAQQDTVDEKISEWTRGIKLLQAKTEEYQSQTMNVKAIPEDIRINTLVEEEVKVKQLKEKVAGLQSQVDLYAMLPHDEKAAKKEVEKLKAELERLRRKRDAMWENITNG